MSEVTVRQLAEVLATPVERLLEQLVDAGMEFSDPDQEVTRGQKVRLLNYLRENHGKKGTATSEDAPKKITLKRRKKSEITVASGSSKRGKQTVNVEVRQKRTYVKRDEEQADPVDAEREEALRKLEESRKQQEAELKAIEEAAAKRKAKADAKEAEAKKAEEERAAAEQAAKEAQAEAEAEAQQAEEAAAAKASKETKAKKPSKKEALESADDEMSMAEKQAALEASQMKKAGEDRKSKTRSKVREVSAEDKALAERSNRSRRGKKELHLSGDSSARRTKRGKSKRSMEQSRASSGQHGFSKPTAPIVREVEIGETIVVSDLAQKLAMKGSQVVKALFNMGVMATITQNIDHDTAVLVVEELGHKALAAADTSADAVLSDLYENEAEAVSRPPVVTIMGHVDHGKTSLLDHIRKAKVAGGEAGGITQHIGAYHVDTKHGVVSFLDTPGHAAFTSMRARGAKLTDIVVLIVAADDGIKPQTVEGIKHAKAANVPLIVAINKMDLDSANPDNVKQGLTQHEIVPEDWGGDVPCVPISAKTGQGIDDLLEAISLQAEIMELKAPAKGAATGIVVEASLDKGRGSMATVLVQQGQLEKGNFAVVGAQYGRIRAMFNEAGKQVDAAGPSIPVQVLGLSGVPAAGDELVVVADERMAKEVASERERRERESRLVKRSANRLEDVMAQMQQGNEQQSLNIVIKADVQGSVEALRNALEELSNDDIKIRVVLGGVGGITESDATLASASDALIIGFNARADAKARKLIENEGLDIRYYSIIYEVIDQVKQVAEGILGMEVREEIIGIAEVRDVFRSSRFGAVAGCLITEGVVRKSNPIRVLRDDVVVFQGELESLRRFKEDVAEVKEGTECGIGVKEYNDVKAGDQIECYERTEVQRQL